MGNKLHKHPCIGHHVDACFKAVVAPASKFGEVGRGQEKILGRQKSEKMHVKLSLKNVLFFLHFS